MEGASSLESSPFVGDIEMLDILYFSLIMVSCFLDVLGLGLARYDFTTTRS